MENEQSNLDEKLNGADQKMPPGEHAGGEEPGKTPAGTGAEDLAMPDAGLNRGEQADIAGDTGQSDPTADTAAEDVTGGGQEGKADTEDWNENSTEAEMLKMMEVGQGEPGAINGHDLDSARTGQARKIVEKMNFDPLKAEPGAESKNLNMLLDVSLPISIELGRTVMAIEDILNLGPGSVVELDKLAGEPVDLLVNNKLLAKGEVVVIDENFGVRITNMVSPGDRIRSLQ